MEALLLAFIPLFVAIDVFGVLPLFVGITDGLDGSQRRTLVMQATATAFCVSVVILVMGKLVFEVERAPGLTLGVVPLGAPLIMGPAALTTIMYLVDTHGYVLALVSLLVNLLIVWQVFSRTEGIIRILGRAGSQAVAKVGALFLAGIVVMMIRSGIQGMLPGRQRIVCVRAEGGL